MSERTLTHGAPDAVRIEIMTPTRVLVADDSPLIRQILMDMIRREPDLDVVGYARDGEEALLRIAELNPDVVTLDLTMPRLDGLGCLRELMNTRPVPAVVISTGGFEGVAKTVEALAVGAIDAVRKPDHGSISTLRGIREELIRKVRGAAGARIHRTTPAPPLAATQRGSDRVVLVACSTGGPRALAAMLAGIPEGFDAPMLVVQSQPAEYVEALAARLDAVGPLRVRAAKAGDRLEPGVALLFPGDDAVTVSASADLVFEKSRSDRPADRLFASAAEAFGARCVAVVLTGEGCDGAEGARAIREAGGRVIAESEATCAVAGMPRATVESGAASRVVPVQEIGAALVVEGG